MAVKYQNSHFCNLNYIIINISSNVKIYKNKHPPFVFMEK